MPQCRLPTDAVAQLIGAREHGRDQATSWQLGATGSQGLPSGYPGVPLLPLCPGMHGPTRVPVPLAVRGGP